MPLDPLSPFHRSVLPHLTPVGRTFFVTWRCKDALPVKIIRSLKAKYDREVERILLHEKDYQKQEHLINRARYRFFKNYECQLDQAPYGACHLKKTEVASIVMNKIHAYDGVYYDLIAYSIMPNHCHVVMDFGRQIVDEENSLLPVNELSLSYRPLHEVMRLIKGGSSREINKVLGLTGTPFWQKDSYDHLVKDARALGNIVEYIRQNPVEAGLVDRWENWPHTWLRM